MRRDNHAHARAIAGATLLAAVAVAACTNDRDRTQATQQQQAERAPTPEQAPGMPGVDVDKVKDEPDRFYNKQVRLAGEVDEIYGDRAFRLEGTGWAFDDDITVLMKKPMDEAAGGMLREDDELVVLGTVRRFTVAEIERDLGWDLSPEIEIRLKDRPVIVADSVRKISAPGQQGEQPQDAQKTAGAGQAGATIATVTEIVEITDPKALAGRPAEIPRETVQAIAGKAIWIGPTMAAKVLVVPTQIPKDLAVGDTVSASGTLREVPDDALDTWQLPKDLAGDLDKAVYIEAVTLRELPAEGDERRN